LVLRNEDGVMNWSLAVMDVFDIPEGYLHLFMQEGML
jgi:hypothetical protein